MDCTRLGPASEERRCNRQRCPGNVVTLALTGSFKQSRRRLKKAATSLLKMNLHSFKLHLYVGANLLNAFQTTIKAETSFFGETGNGEGVRPVFLALRHLAC